MVQVCICCINRSEVSDAKVSKTEPIQSKRLLAGVKAVEPKQPKLDKDNHVKQSSLKVVGKLNPPKELNQEKVQLQFAQE